MGTNLTCVKAAGGSISTSPKRDSGNLTEGESVIARAFWPDWRGDRSSVFGLTNALLAGGPVDGGLAMSSGGIAVIQMLSDDLVLIALVGLKHLIGN